MENLNRVLTIENAGLDAEGNYICTVNGKGGIKSKVVSLAMEGEAKLLFRVCPKCITVCCLLVLFYFVMRQMLKLANKRRS